MARRKSKTPSAIRYLSLATILALASSVAYLLFFPPMPNASWETRSVTVPKGSSAAAIARLLSENGVIRHPSAFRVTASVFGMNRSLKAGRYRFEIPLSTWQALMKLRAGAVAYHKVTIAEGLTMARIAGILQQQAGVDSLGFMEVCRDPELLKLERIPGHNLEGYLYPDTYDLEWGTPPRRAVEAMLGNFRSNFDTSWTRVLESRKLSMHQAVIMASLVEREAQVDSERAIIASIFYNRLRLYRPLESCASIEYILPRHKNTRLTYNDLKIDSPYNTYKKIGLPPGPISNPGRRSLEAAVFPAKTDYLYFVSRGDGGHMFSRTLQEHIRAKNLCERLKGR